MEIYKDFPGNSAKNKHICSEIRYSHRRHRISILSSREQDEFHREIREPNSKTKKNCSELRALKQPRPPVHLCSILYKNNEQKNQNNRSNSETIITPLSSLITNAKKSSNKFAMHASCESEKHDSQQGTKFSKRYPVRLYGDRSSSAPVPFYHPRWQRIPAIQCFFHRCRTFFFLIPPGPSVRSLTTAPGIDAVYRVTAIGVCNSITQPRDYFPLPVIDRNVITTEPSKHTISQFPRGPASAIRTSSG